MYSKVIVVFAALALAGANDIYQAANDTAFKRVFEDHFKAEWSWSQQSRNVFVNSSRTISKINITDLRDGKDGIAQIVSGGLGHKNVTISLKSPAALRGFDFLVAVFAEYLDGEQTGVPEVYLRPDEAENNPQVSSNATAPTNITALPIGTGRPDMAILPTVKPETNTTPVPDDETKVPVATTVSTNATAPTNVTALPIGTGRPDMAIFPTIKPDNATSTTERAEPTKAVTEETEVPEEFQEEPKMQAFVQFHPPPTGRVPVKHQ